MQTYLLGGPEENLLPGRLESAASNEVVVLVPIRFRPSHRHVSCASSSQLEVVIDSPIPRQIGESKSATKSALTT